MSLAADLRALLGDLGPECSDYLDATADQNRDADPLCLNEMAGPAHFFMHKADAALLELATRCSKAEADARFYESLSCQAEAELDAVIEHGQELTDFFKEATDADD